MLLFCFLVAQERIKNARFGRDKNRLDQQDGPISQGQYSTDQIRYRVRKMLSDSPTEENGALVIKGKRKFLKLINLCFFI